jgi:hypothetical protein
VPDSVKQALCGEYGDKVVQAFEKLFAFDPPPAR